jgi:hypothetical protein
MSNDPHKKAKKCWLRKAVVKQRYGGISDRTLTRAVKDKRIPPPHFPMHNEIPMWLESELDENEARAAIKRWPVSTESTTSQDLA